MSTIGYFVPDSRCVEGSGFLVTDSRCVENSGRLVPDSRCVEDSGFLVPDSRCVEPRYPPIDPTTRFHHDFIAPSASRSIENDVASLFRDGGA